MDGGCSLDNWFDLCDCSQVVVFAGKVLPVSKQVTCGQAFIIGIWSTLEAILFGQFYIKFLLM